MPHYESNSVYVTLKGDWPADLLDEANRATEAFFEDLDQDDCGENDIPDSGSAYAYDADIPGEDSLDALFAVLSEGPAWIVRVEQGDELSITNYVYGPNLSEVETITGNLNDPSIPFSKIDDRIFIDKIRSSVAINQMNFRNLT